MKKKKVPSRGTQEGPKPPEAGRRQLFEALRRALRARGLTYARLAERLGMSESGVKKLFAQQDCALSRLEEISHAAGLSLAELIETASRPPFEQVELTDTQQRALLGQPLLLGVFWKLSVERWTTRQVAAAFGLRDAALRRALSELDRLDLIALEQPGDRVRLRHGDLSQWLPRGPLLGYLHDRWGRDVLERALGQGGALRLHQMALRPETRAELEAELSRVLDAFLRRSRAEQLTSRAADAPPHGVLLALAEGSFVRPDQRPLGAGGAAVSGSSGQE